MKHLHFFSGLICIILAIAGCKKGNLPNPGGSSGNSSGYFFENTEWTGVANTYGQTYPQPFYLRFNGDTTVSVYALFAWVEGNAVVYHDSTIGKITGVDTANGQTTISVIYPLSNDQQTFTFPDKNTLTGGSISGSSAAPSTQYTVHLQLNPAKTPLVDGSSWNTSIITDKGPTENMHEFPDIDGISFFNGNKITYIRGGKISTYTPTTQDQILIEGYVQNGPRLYFAGYNEAVDRIIQYFGVLSADGKIILADCRNRQYARLPYYTQTIYWYGSPGVTPTTNKSN